MIKEIEMEQAGKIVILEEVGPTVGDLKEYLEKTYPNDKPVEPLLRSIFKLIDTADELLREERK